MSNTSEGGSEAPYWSDYFYYDESSPTCLRWKVPVYSGKNYNVCKRKVGDVAGGLKKNSRYSQVQLNNTNYSVHRIIFEMFSGTLEEGFVVDHINSNQQDNRIVNLRKVTLKVNCRNTKKAKNNTSGVTGVSKTTVKGYVYWLASFRNLDGELVQKSFSVARHGDSVAFKQACDYRTLMISELNKLGAGYTENHGKDKECL